jgi:flagellar M-ring protein FliF
MNPLLAGLRNLGAARLLALAAVTIAMLAMFTLLALRGGGGGGKMSLLYADLDPRDAGQIADQLDRAHITHEESGAGDRIMVPESEVAHARVLLAKAGLPSGGSIGYEIFDRGDGLTATNFEQEINQTRALEGEIARSIRAMSGVRGARVHLVLPRREAFAQNSEAAQASVMIMMAGGARLDGGGVQAVLNLVAAAVPGLKPQNIALVDSRGTLLARAGGDVVAAVSNGEELQRAAEMRLARAVEDMLENALGAGHVRAEASVTMNFTKTAETKESYDPDQQVVRSSATVNSTSKSSEQAKPVSVQNNLPNADAGSGSGSGSQDNRQEETTNYEIGKTVRSISEEQPQITRVSMAVMVDGSLVNGADGKPVYHDRTADELERIRRLVENTIGFDAKRGDTLEVVPMRFAAPVEIAALPAGIFGVPIDHADIMALAQSGLMALAVLAAVMFVLRPLALRLSSGAGDEVMLPSGAIGFAPAGGAIAALATGSAGGGAGPGGGDTSAALALADDSMVAIANIEGQLRASSMRQLAGMVEKHPEESLAIIRSWMSQEAS